MLPSVTPVELGVFKDCISRMPQAGCRAVTPYTNRYRRSQSGCALRGRCLPCKNTVGAVGLARTGLLRCASGTRRWRRKGLDAGKMGKLGDILSHPNEILPLVSRLRLTSFSAATCLPVLIVRLAHWLGAQVRIYRASKAAGRLPSDPDLAFCYDLLNKVSRR